MTDLQTTEKDGVLIIRIAVHRICTDGEVARVSKQLEDQALSQGDKVVLDLSQVRQMSSAMLGKLVALNKACTEYNITLRLCSMAPPIKEVLKTTGLNKVLNIHDTQDSALAAFQKKKRWFW